MEVMDVLASDVKIVDATTRTADPSRGVQTLRFPGQFMPDGKDFLGEAPAKLEPSILKEWCNQVRRVYSERESRKEAEAASRAAVPSSGGIGADSRPDESARGGPSIADDGETWETSLEASLQSEVTRWADREREAAAEVASLHDQLDAAQRRLDAAVANGLRAQAVLEFYQGQADAP